VSAPAAASSAFFISLRTFFFAFPDHVRWFLAHLSELPAPGIWSNPPLLILQVHFALDSAPLGSSRCFLQQLHNKIVHGPNGRGCRHLPPWLYMLRTEYTSPVTDLFSIVQKTEMWVRTDNLKLEIKIHGISTR